MGLGAKYIVLVNTAPTWTFLSCASVRNVAYAVGTRDVSCALAFVGFTVRCLPIRSIGT